jgi:hypothetical protein
MPLLSNAQTKSGCYAVAITSITPTTCASWPEDIIRGMQEHFGLGRLAASTRARFEAAVAAGTR